MRYNDKTNQITSDLIKSGGGTGPVKPGNLPFRQGAKSREMSNEYCFFLPRCAEGVFFMFCGKRWIREKKGFIYEKSFFYIGIGNGRTSR